MTFARQESNSSERLACIGRRGSDALGVPEVPDPAPGRAGGELAAVFEVQTPFERTDAVHSSQPWAVTAVTCAAQSSCLILA